MNTCTLFPSLCLFLSPCPSFFLFSLFLYSSPPLPLSLFLNSVPPPSLPPPPISLSLSPPSLLPPPPPPRPSPSLSSERDEKYSQWKDAVGRGLPGMDVCGVTAITITNSSLEWQWEGHGLKIHVGENTLPSGIEQCHINVNASLSGQYEFPEDEYLVSPIF